MIRESRVRTRLVTRFENLDFVKNVLFPLLKNSKSGEERGHRLRILHARRRNSTINIARVDQKTGGAL